MSKEKKKKTGKSTLMVIKRLITKEDLRSLLALIVTVGGLTVITVRPETATQVIAAIMLVLGWYFTTKERER